LCSTISDDSTNESVGAAVKTSEWLFCFWIFRSSEVKKLAAVRATPSGVLSSWAMPESIRLNEASFSARTSPTFDPTGIHGGEYRRVRPEGNEFDVDPQLFGKTSEGACFLITLKNTKNRPVELHRRRIVSISPRNARS
jgi:hypothetical protein